MKSFKLAESFIEEYKEKEVDWGPIGEIVYLRTYSRKKSDGSSEQWYETIQRVVEGCYSIQKEHCEYYKLPWKNDKSQRSAQIMFDKIFNFKFVPAGRNLWMQGTDFIKEKGGFPLLNCAATSTEDINIRGSFSFCWAMDALMLGAGVSADTLGAGKLTIKNPKIDGIFVVPDSREGWVESLKHLLDSYFEGKAKPEFDYSSIRPYGMPIKGFGGISSGPEPLKVLHNGLSNLLNTKIGEKITSVDIADIMDMIGVCVVSGNVRRSAILMLGDWNDKEYVTMKDYNLHPKELKSHRWSSNNSIKAEVGKTNYAKIAESIILNGEPGLVWLDNIRTHGRMNDAPDTKDKYAIGTNPCGEAILENLECCVSGETRIQTRTGNPKIKDVVGTEIEIFNGDEWSKVVPFKTAETELYRIYLSDGSCLDCTKDHGWNVRPQGKKIYRRVDTENLQIGSRVISYSLNDIEGINEPYAFELGLFAGDGYLDAGRRMICICGDKSKLQDLGINGSWRKPQIIEGCSMPYNRVDVTKYINEEIAAQINDKTKGLPEYIFNINKQSLLEFIAGWIETDGTVTKQLNTDSYRIYGTKEKMQDLLLLLRRVGINHASIRKMGDIGDETNLGIRNYELWYCGIPSYECAIFPTRIKKTLRIGSKYKKNNAYKKSLDIDASRKQKIIKIEKLDGIHQTYCFTEEKNHMGVFGTVLTYQCNLVESFPSRHDSYEEFKETLKYAYLYAKTVTLISTHVPETNAVMMKNRRIGVSQTGIIDAFVKHGRRIMMQWSDKGYKYLQELDELYSNWLCIPRSIRLSTCKPSGTTALLPGVSAGIHYPHAQYYIRRIRIASNSPLVEPLKKAGFEYEFSVNGMDEEEKKKTLVFSFPVFEKYFEKGKDEVSIWEQVKNVVDYQRWWSDNAVSATITFNKEEQKDIPLVLEAYEDNLKSISFLPILDHKYDQAPYETITKEKYEKMIENLVKPDFKNMSEAEAVVVEKFCNNDTCSIA